MSVLDRLRARFTRPAPVEQRRATPTASTFALGTHGAGGALYNAVLAENLSVVTACVELISSTIAALPALVYLTRQAGRDETPDHPLARMIAHGVNPRSSWFDWMTWSVAQELLHGNSLSVLERGPDGELTALWPVPWGNVAVGMTSTGAMVFDVQNLVSPWASYGERRRYLASEVLLIRGRSDDGFLGRSVLSRAASVLETATGAQTFAASISRQGVNPAGVIGHPQALNAQAKDYLERTLSEGHAGAAQARRILILDESMTFTPYDVQGGDQELLASRRFGGEELARLFNVPPSLIGELSFGSFSNVETAGRFFSTFCIAPHVRRIESEFARTVFQGDGHHLMIDLAGLQRGDEVGRWQTYAIALANNVLSVAEVRQAEGWPPAAAAPAANP